MEPGEESDLVAALSALGPRMELGLVLRLPFDLHQLTDTLTPLKRIRIHLAISQR